MADALTVVFAGCIVIGFGFIHIGLGLAAFGVIGLMALRGLSGGTE